MTKTFEPEGPKTVDLTKNFEHAALLGLLPLLRPGDWVIYHVGPNAGGAHKGMAMQASDKGYLYLVQKKLGYARFQYMAQRTSKRFVRWD